MPYDPMCRFPLDAGSPQVPQDAQFVDLSIPISIRGQGCRKQCGETLMTCVAPRLSQLSETLHPFRGAD